jgi:hypothetical protein
MLRPCAQIHADFPELEVAETEDEIREYGRTLAETITGMLVRLGYPAHGLICDDHGWCIDLRPGKGFLWFEISGAEVDYLMTTQGPPRLVAEVLDRLNGEMRKDPRFHDVRWFDRVERDDDGGDDRPISEDDLRRLKARPPGLMRRILTLGRAKGVGAV